MDTTDKEVDMPLHSGRPLTDRSFALAGRVLDRLRAKHVGTQLVASNDATSGEFNGEAVVSCHRASTCNPLRYKGWLNTKDSGQGSLIAGMLDGKLDGQNDHAHGR